MDEKADIHPLVAQLREEVAREDFMTHAEIAREIRVSRKTLYIWMTQPVVPHKLHRRRIQAWLEERRDGDVQGETA